MKLAGKRVLILGLGESGFAAARWCDRQGAKVRVADTRSTPPYLEELRRCIANPTGMTSGHVDFRAGEFGKDLLDGIDLLVLSPGLNGGMMIVIHARAAGIPVVGEIELFAQALRDLGQRVPVLAITGTNGKTTTTALVGHLLSATGKRVGVAGNISPSALTALMDFQDQGALPDLWVLELSSFQLETTKTLNATASAVLNISEDHLDRYIDVNEYASVKARIFDISDGVHNLQVLNRDDRRVRRMARAGRDVITFGLDAPGTAADFGIRVRADQRWLVCGEDFLLPLSDVPLRGTHNAANAMAALALCSALGYAPTSLLPALRSFKGLPHRVEKVAEIDGVVWYDDSKGTNVGATAAALQGLGVPVVIILGGDGKGQDFSPLARVVKAHARAVVLLGRDGPLIEKEVARSGVPTVTVTNMDEAVAAAARLAQAGDAVLLSPACASFDMFRNYEHRAQVFIAAVRALETVC